ncbi:MAG: divalent metal cation transporter, partial [Candidatus Eisenbacteria bacterium]
TGGYHKVAVALEMIFSRPDLPAILLGVIPRDGNGVPSLFGRAPEGGLTVLGLHGSSLYIAMGILGATVMPHNLYLHSSLVQSRRVDDSRAGKQEACNMNLVDSVVALNAALFVNGAILVLAAAVFHQSGRHEVASLEQAHQLLAPLLGTALASTLFAVALLCAGQASTITGTLAGQIVMEGFLRIRVQPWLRRLISRGLAIIPAALVILLQGEKAVDALLVLSQVVLSMQLAFAVIPLITFTSDRRRMGDFTNAPWVIALSVLVAAIIVTLNAKLVIDTVGGWIATTHGAWWVWASAVPLAAGLGIMLLFIVFAPLLERAWPLLWKPRGGGATVQAVGSRSHTVAMAPVTAPLELQTGGYHKVAVALELGPADTSVLAALSASAFHPEAELIFVHVVESAASRYLGEDALDAESRADADALAAIASNFEQRGVRARVRLGNGEATREIARIVGEEKADLVITGSHGHSGLADMVYGNTVSGVRHLVRCPVLTVPPTS